MKKIAVSVVLIAGISLLGIQVAVGSGSNCEGHEPTVVGTRGADVLRGTPGDDVIAALGGDDVVHGLGGDDVICGGAGSDLIVGGSGNDTIIGGNGEDRLRGGSGADVIDGGAGDDLVRGNGGADELLGQDGADRLFGGKGADVIEGGDGVDPLGGGAGNDSLSGGAGNDTLRGGRGDDVLEDPTRTVGSPETATVIPDAAPAQPIAPETESVPATTTTEAAVDSAPVESTPEPDLLVAAAPVAPNTTTAAPTTTTAAPRPVVTPIQGRDGVAYGFFINTSELDEVLGNQGHQIVQMNPSFDQMIDALDTVASYDAQAIIQLDSINAQTLGDNQTFSRDRWINTLERFGDDPRMHREIQERINDGTIAAIYLIDEPFHDRWGPNRLRTPGDVDELAGLVKQYWPNAKVTARVSAISFFSQTTANESNPPKLQHIDYFWHMYRHDHGPLTAEEAVAEHNWVFNDRGQPIRPVNNSWQLRWYGEDSPNIRMEREAEAAALLTPPGREIGTIFSLQAYNGGSGESGDKWWNNNDYRMSPDEMWRYTQAAVANGHDLLLNFRWEREADRVAEFTDPSRREYERATQEIARWAEGLG